MKKDSKKKEKGKSSKKIVILQRGWVFVGDFYKVGSHCRLENAACVRRWGTTKGLGELAKKGPLSNTVLDPCPTVRFHELTVIATVDCAEEAWKNVSK